VILEAMSRSLALPLAMLHYMAASAPVRYKVYQIPKRRRGEFRTIAQPANEIKILQRWVIKNVLSTFPVHEAAVAYVSGIGIQHNARLHAGDAYLLKMDFRDFFPSIKKADVESFLKEERPNFNETDIEILCRLLLWRPRVGGDLQLSIGAPSSPILSNIIMYEFDEILYEYCRIRGVVYSRYADDLAFSTNEKGVLGAIADQVAKAVATLPRPHLAINEAKTVHASKATRRRLTGLILANDSSVSIGRDRKRMIRAKFHHYMRGLMNLEQLEELRGLLAFVNAVEPSFLRRLSARYGNDKITELLARPTRQTRRAHDSREGTST
jgi:RNA-directed DNA polymerase